jgi:NAD(P)-dependent dehydrogenase (short-subunit alcohol dehydrogenase family)
LAARTTPEVAEVAEAIRCDGGAADSVTLDITDLQAAAKAITEWGPFDILVNNAGTNRPVTFLEVTVEDFDYVVGLNLRSAFFACTSGGRSLAPPPLDATDVRLILPSNVSGGVL